MSVEPLPITGLKFIPGGNILDTNSNRFSMAHQFTEQ